MTTAHEPTLFDVTDARPIVHVDPKRDRRDLRTHHVRIEPGRGIMSVAFLADDHRIRDVGPGPYAALARLLADPALDPAVIPPGPDTCATCGRVNPMIGDSPKGATRVLFYCDYPCVPGGRTRSPYRRADR